MSAAALGPSPAARVPELTRLVLVGSVIADLMMTVPALPERGGDILAGAARAQAGGGFNVLAAAARLGLRGALLGHVGTGALGSMVGAALAAEGVVELLPRVSGADTGLCVGFIEPDAERTFVTSVGCEAEVGLAGLRSSPVGVSDAVYVSGYDLCYPVTGPAVAEWLSGMSSVPFVVVDPGPLAASIPGEVLDGVLRHTSVLTLNAREVRLLGGSAPALLARLRAGGFVLERDGARGCTVWWGGPGGAVRSEHVGAPSVAAVDSTGAGDAHTGAFLAALSWEPGGGGAGGLVGAGGVVGAVRVAAGGAVGAGGLVDAGGLVGAVRVANAAAAYAVTQVGSATGPTRPELEAFVASAGDGSSF